MSFSPARAAVIQLIHATFNVCIFVLLLVVVDLFGNILTEPHSCETTNQETYVSNIQLTVIVHEYPVLSHFHRLPRLIIN